MTDDGVVTLQIEDEEFNVRKSLLCEHSAYFQAMFSGNYVEKNQNLIVIDVSTLYSVSEDEFGTIYKTYL